jgi:paraquat-inducible protein B
MCYDSSVTPKVFKGEAEKMNQNRIIQLTTSNLTSPTEQWPAYTQQGGVMTLYPSTINLAGEVEAVYFRYPKDPKWTYISVQNGEPVFDQSQGDYQDFEVPIEDEYKLVSKILQYAGMSIREVMAVQFGAAEEQKQSQ